MDDYDYQLAPQPAYYRPSRLQNGPVIVEHIPCIGCKYDLFNMPLHHHCPECNYSLMASINAYRRQQVERKNAKSPTRSVLELTLVFAVIGIIALLSYRMPEEIGLRVLLCILAGGLRVGWAFIEYKIDRWRK